MDATLPQIYNIYEVSTIKECTGLTCEVLDGCRRI